MQKIAPIPSRRDNTWWTGGFNHRSRQKNLPSKSRRDGILLTVCFNPRIKRNHPPLKSRRDDTISLLQSAVPSGLRGVYRGALVRRLKSTVNKIPSLRDFSILFSTEIEFEAMVFILFFNCQLSIVIELFLNTADTIAVRSTGMQVSRYILSIVKSKLQGATHLCAWCWRQRTTPVSTDVAEDVVARRAVKTS